MNLHPFIDATNSDVDFCVSNTKTQKIWLSNCMDTDDYYSHRFRFILRNLSNNTIFEQMFGIAMNYERGRYRFDLQPGATFRVSLPFARMLGFVDNNDNIMSPYRNEQFRIDSSLVYLMFVCMPQEEAWTFYIDPPHWVGLGPSDPRPSLVSPTNGSSRLIHTSAQGEAGRNGTIQTAQYIRLYGYRGTSPCGKQQREPPEGHSGHFTRSGGESRFY